MFICIGNHCCLAFISFQFSLKDLHVWLLQYFSFLSQQESISGEASSVEKILAVSIIVFFMFVVLSFEVANSGLWLNLDNKYNIVLFSENTSTAVKLINYLQFSTSLTNLYKLQIMVFEAFFHAVHIRFWMILISPTLTNWPKYLSDTNSLTTKSKFV